jgi:DNA polymerase-3 subunit delta
MKIAPREVESFLRAPPAAIAAVLLHGPDAGLVSERAARLGRAVVEDLADPFRVSELDGTQLEDHPGRLVEEAQALCLMGGRRLVRVRGATDRATPALGQLLAEAAPAGFTVIEAGELPASSSLRRLAERAATAAVIGCWREEGRDLAAAVRADLQAAGVRVEPAAFEFLTGRLGGDRRVTRTEIEKLALFAASEPGRALALEEVATVTGDSAALGIDDAILAAFLGEPGRLERSVGRLFDEGESPVRLLRAAATQVQRLVRLRDAVDEGLPLGAALAAAKPPIHFRQREAIERIVAGWRAAALLDALLELHAAELACKRTGAPDRLICRAALARICDRAPPRRR